MNTYKYIHTYLKTEAIHSRVHISNQSKEVKAGFRLDIWNFLVAELLCEIRGAMHQVSCVCVDFNMCVYVCVCVCIRV